VKAFAYAERWGHEEVILRRDAGAGLRAIIALHDTPLGPAIGGTRMRTYASEDDALLDALRLARAMTYKSAMAGMRYGGGKAVIVGDPARDKTEALLTAYARAVERLGGRFHTGTDMGLDERDIVVMSRVTRHATHTAAGAHIDSADLAALGVFASIEGAARELGRPLRGLHVAVQGLGEVGGRLARQLLVESLLIAIAGGALGLLAADWTSRALAAVLSKQFQVPRVDGTATDFSVFAFTLGLSVATGIVFGLAPAFASTSPDLTDALRDASRSVTGSRAPRLRAALVVLETALALVLLAAAGTLLKTFLTLRSTHPGFETAHALAADMWLPQPRFTQLPARARFYEDALRRLNMLPGVRSAGFVADLPLNGGTDSLNFRILGRANPSPGAVGAGFNVASTGYFESMGIPLRAGRLFSDADRIGTAPVVVINETAARTFWPDESPVGRQIELPGSNKTSLVLTVVGVTGDVHHVGLAVPPRPEIFIDATQSPLAWSHLVLVVRAHGEPAPLADAVKRAVHEVNPNVPIQAMSTLDDIVARSIIQPRIYTFLLGVFAALAVALAAIGLYGLIAYSVSQRTHELGVRVALGADRGAIVRLVIAQGLKLAGVGALAGLAGAVAATRLLVGLVKGVEPNDPLTFVLVTGALLSAAVVASYLPARRAARVDPIAALRVE
jgi:putative ABC transport system permease protein